MSNIMVLCFTNNATIRKKRKQGLKCILANFKAFIEMSFKRRVRDFIIGRYKDF